MAGYATYLHQESICPPSIDLFKDITDKNALKFGEKFELKSEEFINNAGWVLEDFLLKEECEKMIELAEKIGFQTAEQYCFLYANRKNDRILVDDEGMAKLMWERIRTHVSDLKVKSMGVSWSPCGINPRFRLCRYIGGKGHYFGKHVDGGYQNSKTGEVSFLTLLVYLNSKDEFEGGCTNFFRKEGVYSVVPKAGLCTVFFQDDGRCQHEGEKVTKGKKYIIRTDVMFRNSEAENEFIDSNGDILHDS
ncbi:hypothetical protein LOD99_6948 [Oopsacas minuta]|uniref:Fe2OG dioxygenase domain-containing protein n=1 Tax=Oopsacas minuta TaxID=111878 RepID=A0AAV7JK63_9METZ|nr:hypothetical protein LOD99_6948 [Oopsacas minuta]